MFVNERAIRKRIDIIKEQLNTLGTVSYTHLTLPTMSCV